MAFYLTHLLTDPYAAVRYVAKRSLKHLPGFEDLQYDYLGSADQRRAVQEKMLPRAKAATASSRTKPALLINADGSWQTNKISNLTSRRDDHPMELLE